MNHSVFLWFLWINVLPTPQCRLRSRSPWLSLPFNIRDKIWLFRALSSANCWIPLLILSISIPIVAIPWFRFCSRTAEFFKRSCKRDASIWWETISCFLVSRGLLKRHISVIFVDMALTSLKTGASSWILYVHSGHLGKVRRSRAFSLTPRRQSKHRRCVFLQMLNGWVI